MAAVSHSVSAADPTIPALGRSTEVAAGQVQRAVEEGEFGELEVDTDPDRDSAYGDELESLSTSVNSSVKDYKFEHGRRYHAYQDGKYALPNDDEEINRLELQHRVWQLSLSGRLNLAPIPSTLRSAIDIGCGTGAWAIEFAEAYPNARVLGTDLSPIQPELVPSNLEFLIDDITSPWVFDHKFGYIHSRAITVGIRDWSKLVEECWRNLEPGGWVEFQEYHFPFTSDDGTIENGVAFSKWNARALDAAGKAGTKLDAILGVPNLLHDKGFVNVGTASTKWPLGPWTKGKREKRMGTLFAQDISGNLEGLSMRLFTKVLGMTPQEVSSHCADVAEDIRGGKMHVYMPIDFVWAQKPGSTME